MQQPVQM